MDNADTPKNERVRIRHVGVNAALDAGIDEYIAQIREDDPMATPSRAIRALIAAGLGTKLRKRGAKR